MIIKASDLFELKRLYGDAGSITDYEKRFTGTMNLDARP